jgi:hypothetical protein
VNATFSRLTSPFARIAAALAAAAGIASCGGGVSANPSPVVNDPAITILPATAVLYSGMPTTFVLSGGTGSYIVTSSNQAVLPIAGGVTGRSVTLVPSPVSADTVVTLTARDTGTAVPVTATVTVRPGTVGNNVTITPSATQSSTCGAAICAGGDAEVRVTISQGGIPLAARGVSYQVVSGDFRIIASGFGVTPEVLVTSANTTTDELGVARMRIRALPEALAQTALLQITDLGTGAFQRTSFTISQSGNAPLAAVPNRISFTGPDTLNCATGLVADVIVFGGRPPYQITQPGSVASVNPNVVSTSGGRFSVTANGGCATDASIGIVDTVGATTTVTVSNVLGTVEVTPELIVSPTTVSLAACTDIASVLVAGGTGQFSAATGSGSLQAPVAASTVSISRARPSSAPGITSPQTLQVFVSDGKTVRTVTVTLTGEAATSACAAP